MWSEMRRGLWGARETDRGSDVDYYIPDLNKLLKLRKRTINLLIWNTVSKSDPKVFKAVYYPNRQYEHRKSIHKSSLVLELTDIEWIPDKRGRLCKPCDLTKEQLHRDFKDDNGNGWLDEIGFGEQAKKASEEYKRREQQASSLNIPLEVVSYLDGLSEEEREKECKELVRQFKHKEASRKHAQRMQQESLPYDKALSEAFLAPGKSPLNGSMGGGGVSPNPSRRRKNTQKDIAASIENGGESGERFSFGLRKKWNGKNDQVRVDFIEWYGGQCQICKKTFTQRNGTPYFEGLYLVSHTIAEWIDRVGNVLCLCPWHSAMFQFGPKEVEENIIQQVMQLKVEAEGGDGHPIIRMKLCGELVEIEFAEKHLIDLQEMVKKSQELEHNILRVPPDNESSHDA